MKDQLRNIDGYFTIILKLLYLYDIVYFMLMKPLEALGYKRYSDAIIVSKEKIPSIHMSLNGKLLKQIRSKSILEEDLSILFLLKSNFKEGFLKLDFINVTTYRMEVNKKLFQLISNEIIESSGQFQIKTIKEIKRRQMVAKLMLTSSSYLWKCIKSNRINELLNKINREETIKVIEVEKIKALNK